MALMIIDEPRVPGKKGQAAGGHPLFRLGFRPFYLLAASFAAISVPLWIARYLGWTQALGNVDVNWHMHEMVFGFAIAVIIGFVFTAGRNWTGLWTPRGNHLAALAGLWLAGRLAMLAAPPVLAALVDMLFLPLAAWPIYSVLKRSGNKRNMFLVLLLSLLTVANGLFHVARLGWIDIAPFTPIHAAILVIVMIESVIGGRVIPGFTSNATGVKTITNPKLDKICITLTALACLAWIVRILPPFSASLAFAAACAQAVRLAGWKLPATLKNPLLWILHVSYAWIPLGFFALAAASLNLVSASAAFHILAVGSMSGLIIGMITRTALGHTGRPLKAGGAELAMYVLVQLGVIARFVAAVSTTDLRDHALACAAVSWSGAFLLYAAVYGRYLWNPRIDGREG
ncbi:NnrS family protein [Noviherbaspirillum autotrophicum]|uniref:Membrane protein n=1 Tax=Noviherbaspirillum autotrophicum TaxID=709839 RepID=A0A0C2BJT9_9BURK|nr:NnrS family protein [Noviherbaspirillum autotrophicum]KIF81470.1 membrane protein [Noviherbaspirillum autotrophicum]